MNVSAYCPGHISGYFQKIAGRTSATTGSIGAGIVIDPGVTVTATPASRTRISVLLRSSSGHIRQVANHAPPLSDALMKVGVDARIVTECRLPIGAGFGLSAAALLATLTAVNRLCCLDMDPNDLAAIAHETEVEHCTGLGDVAACQAGGRVVRAGTGINADIQRFFDIPGPVYAISFGPIPTPSVLGSRQQMDRVNKAFPDRQPRSFEDFFTLCRQFSGKSGLETPEVSRAFAACAAANIPAGMTMLGNGVFAVGERARAILRVHGTVYSCRVAVQGPRIIREEP